MYSFSNNSPNLPKTKTCILQLLSNKKTTLNYHPAMFHS